MDDTTIVGENVGMARLPTAGAWMGSFSGISWSSVIAGAFVAVAVSFIIIALGTGIGMVVASPYASSPSAETMTVIGALWLVFSQSVGFGVGGYVAGRSRRTPTGLHSSEVKFRDGANGLVVWAVGVVITSLVLAVGVQKLGAAAGKAGGGATALAATSQAPSMAYFTDALLRPNPQANAGQSNAGQANAGSGAAAPAAAPGAQAAPGGASNAPAANGGENTSGNPSASNAERGQATRILATSLGPTGISNDDKTYLAQMVSAQTGISQSDAQSRVNDVVNRIKSEAMQAADTARKAAAFLSFWTFLSLLFGATCGALGGILGGDLRDEFAGRYAVAVAPR